MTSIRICAAIALCACAGAAPAAVLYKSVGANGVLEFSDLPPENSRNIEQIRIPEGASGAAPTTPASGPSREEELLETDAAVASANARLDLAEHALAEARRSIANDFDPLRMVVLTRMARADEQRLAFYKKDVLLARAQLLEVLKEKRKAQVPPTFTASNVWVPFNPAARP